MDQSSNHGICILFTESHELHIHISYMYSAELLVYSGRYMTLRILLAADNVQHSNSQELLSTLLKNLGSVAKSLEPKELCKLLEAYQSLQNGSNAGTSGTANVAEEAAGPSNSKLPFVNGSHCGQASSSVVPVQSKATMVVTPGMMDNHC
jgi:hypothetical protein